MSSACVHTCVHIFNQDAVALHSNTPLLSVVPDVGNPGVVQQPLDDDSLSWPPLVILR